MKKIFAALFSFLIIFSSLSIGISSYAKEKEIYPLVIFPGYSSPYLWDNDKNERVWPLDFTALKTYFKDNATSLSMAISQYKNGNKIPLNSQLGNLLKETLEPITMDEEGKSIHNVVAEFSGDIVNGKYINKAEQTKYSNLLSGNPNVYPVNKIEHAKLKSNDITKLSAVAGKINQLKKMGIKNPNDYIFIYQNDWRQSQIDYIPDMEKYINDVLKITGCKKVDISALSHGGQCASTYLSTAVAQKNLNTVHKAVLNVPATAGTHMSGDPMNNKFEGVDYEIILKFIDVATYNSHDEKTVLGDFFKNLGSTEILNEFLSQFVQEYAIDIVDKIPSLWDFIPLKDYENTKNRLLTEGNSFGTPFVDSIKSKKLIEKSDKFHYEIIQNLSLLLNKALKKCDIAIITCYGYDSITSQKHNGDYIIDTETSSGAYCAPFESTFSENYTQQNTNDKNKNHYHLSPSFDIDASTAFLPNNTWFVKDAFHGMHERDPYQVEFTNKFLYEDTIKNVYSDSQYPQFEQSFIPQNDIYLRFDNTSFGFHSNKDTSFYIKNISKENSIDILEVQSIYADIQSFKKWKTKNIKPNEYTVYGIGNQNIEEFHKPFKISVKYRTLNNPALIKEKIFDITPINDNELKKYNHLYAPASTFVFPIQKQTSDNDNSQQQTTQNNKTSNENNNINNTNNNNNNTNKSTTTSNKNSKKDKNITNRVKNLSSKSNKTKNTRIPKTAGTFSSSRVIYASSSVVFVGIIVSTTLFIKKKKLKLDNK